jgi:ribosomal protein S18 acetylase RimI-like enzyme
MNLKEMKQSVDMLYSEWDLGKKDSKAIGKTCAWIYLFEILEETEKMIIEKDNNKVIGICGYSKWNSNKNTFKKNIYKILKKVLINSPLVKNKEAIYKYNKDYEYTPSELKEYFDGEISILIVDKNYRSKKIGKKIINKIFELAKNDNMKNIQILTDESCNFEFYKSLGCIKVYEKVIPNSELDKVGNKKFEIGYIYEKKLKEDTINKSYTLDVIKIALKNSWSKETCYSGCINNYENLLKETGQCAISSLIINDYFGGKIEYGYIKELNITHYWNIIDNKVIDVTKGQFEKEYKYLRVKEKTKKEILASEDTQRRYNILKEKVENYLKFSV